MTVNRTLWRTIKLGGGMNYLQNKPSWPPGRTGKSSSECTCAANREILVLWLLPPVETLGHRQLPSLPAFITNPGVCREILRRVARVTSPVQVATFVSALVAGYFGRAWPMCLGSVPAYWPGEGGGGRAVKGFLLQWSVRDLHHTELEAPRRASHTDVNTVQFPITVVCVINVYQ